MQTHIVTKPNHNSGVNNPTAKLNDAKVRRIRSLLSQGHTQRELCNIFSISKTALNNIALGKAWRHIK